MNYYSRVRVVRFFAFFDNPFIPKGVVPDNGHRRRKMKQVWKFTAAAAAVLCFSGGALAADHVMDADIVIVGAGAGGMTAGAAAVDNGLKTIVLEKKCRCRRRRQLHGRHFCCWVDAAESGQYWH